jgi:hypothetical protein
VAAMLGLIACGRQAANAERARDGRPALTVGQYLTSPDYLSATLENWESEFLQMGVFVLLSVWLREKGSAESRPLDPAQESHPHVPAERQPALARRSGVARRLYENSLSLALFALFALAFAGHLASSLAHYNEEQAAAGAPSATLGEYVANAQFWFESLQNWQSEFLSLLAIVMLSVWLRQKDSPQSKPVESPHDETRH